MGSAGLTCDLRLAGRLTGLRAHDLAFDVAEARELRRLHIAARITPNSRRLRLDHDWPWTAMVIEAIHRVRAAFRALTVTAAPSAQAALR